MILTLMKVREIQSNPICVEPPVYYNRLKIYIALVSQYEPPHDKTNKMACAPSEDSDQPLASAQSDQSSLYAQWVVKDPMFLHADSEGADQTGWMPRLI